jgi:hypothetical protein
VTVAAQSHLRGVIVRALEALEDGDEVFAAAVLRSAASDFKGPEERCFRCPHCGLTFEFHGLLDDHVRLVHYGGYLSAADDLDHGHKDAKFVKLLVNEAPARDEGAR